MTLGLLTTELRIPANRSLKGKRKVLKSIKDRARNRFNISIAEVGHQDNWQLATLAIACVSCNSSEAHRLLNHVLKFLENNREIEVIDVSMETL